MKQRKPRKPPKSAKCDASIGVEVDKLNTPNIKICKEPATETLIVLGLENWLCENHYLKLKDKYTSGVPDE